MAESTIPLSTPRTSSIARFFYLRRSWVGLLFILPWLISVVWFDVIPFFVNLYLSFTDYSVGLVVPELVGFANYRTMFFEDDLYLKSLWNTFSYLAMSVRSG